MSVKIDRKNKQFYLKTKNTLYVIGLLGERYPVNLYYGRKGKAAAYDCRNKKETFAPYMNVEGETCYPETFMAEFPTFGNGDFRPTALKLRNLKNGSDTCDFVFRAAHRTEGRPALEGLPYAEANEKTETLELVMDDKATGCTLRLFYTVFYESDVISRYFVLENKTKKSLRIEKCMSLSLDIPSIGYELISNMGNYYNERAYQRGALMTGTHRIASRRGASGHSQNPFMMLVGAKTTEEKGEAYGFNFVYSGSFVNEIDVCRSGSTRVLLGLGDECFSYLLESGESFTSPEAIMTYTTAGMGQVSRNMHLFVREHILPKEKFSCRPVVLNSWEAVRFDIDEELLLRFAKEAAACGMDMLVMDDGWFGARVNDRAGLGDWVENKERFPEGLAAFAKRVKETGIKFGIWIEPEMVNPDSDLYRAHPDWVLEAPGVEPLLSRNQLVLDMANPKVLAYLKDIFSKTFAGVDVDYFKWDMNRNMSAVYSRALPAERQGEAAYRYMLGVYELFSWFCETFPNAMIENCSGGGGRYDLGMMKYSTQIWTSDNTYPERRMYIQHGASLGYPASVMSCHVAKLAECENPRFLDYRFRLAMNGALGYELNILNASEEAKANMKKQVEEYRRYEDLILKGDFYRLLNPHETDGVYAFYFVNEDNSEILLTFLQYGATDKPKEYRLRVPRALTNVTYTDRVSGALYEGAMLQRGLMVKSDGEAQFAKTFHFARRKI